MVAVERHSMMWLIWTMLLTLSSTLHGCDNSAPPAINGNTADVIIAGQKFVVEVAAEDAVRMKGMGGRTSIADGGGMIFAFPRTQAASVMTFVMRDCSIDIDIMYLDGGGRVLQTYTMKAEDPRDEAKGEGKPGDMGNATYENRLKKIYTSRFPATFVIELKAGTITRLGVKEGDKVEFDIAGLKARAK